MATDPTIGTRIRTRRQQLGMTQQELGRLVGVDRASVANWERGKHYPLRYLGKLESVLEVSLGPGGSEDDELEQLEAQAAEILAVTRRMRAERERRASALKDPGDGGEQNREHRATS